MDSGQNDKGIGFAGLQRLVSDIHIPPVPAPTANSVSTAKSASAPGGAATVVPDRDRGRWGLWVLGVVVVGVILIGAFSSNNGGTSSSATTSNTAAVPAQQAQPDLTPAQAEVVESAPPAGDALPLSANEIAYCLAFDARLTALKPMINDTSHKEIDGFNALISNFNSRCSQYHYRPTDMTRAQSYIAAHGSDFSAQASAWLTKLRRGRRSAEGNPSAEAEPTATDDSGEQSSGNPR